MATKARLHWFWRATIAAAAGIAGNIVIPRVLWGTLGMGRQLSDWMTGRGLPWRATQFLIDVIDGLSVSLVAILAFEILRRFGSAFDTELRCRKCDQILRGLSEPRCPECGEPI